MQRTATQVLVLGGGVVGCLCALRLAQAGHRVTLVERGALGRAASWAAAGILSPGAEADGAPFALLARHSRSLWNALVDEYGAVALGYCAAGTMRVALDEEETRALAAEGTQLTAWGIASEPLSPSQVAALEPALCGVHSALRFADDPSVEPRRVMATLAEALHAADVIVARRTVEALIIERDGPCCTGIITSTDRLFADAVVVALGSWSSLMPGLPPALTPATTVAPLRGQMIELRLTAPPLRHVVFGAGGYLVARADGRVLCGATEERAGFAAVTTTDRLAELRARAARLCPILSGVPLADAWAGLRPTTADRLPLLGATSVDQLYLATGHHRNGFLLAPVTAEAVVALVEGRRPPVAIDAFSPLRDRA